MATDFLWRGAVQQYRGLRVSSELQTIQTPAVERTGLLKVTQTGRLSPPIKRSLLLQHGTPGLATVFCLPCQPRSTSAIRDCSRYPKAYRDIRRFACRSEAKETTSGIRFIDSRRALCHRNTTLSFHPPNMCLALNVFRLISI